MLGYICIVVTYIWRLKELPYDMTKYMLEIWSSLFIYLFSIAQTFLTLMQIKYLYIPSSDHSSSLPYHITPYYNNIFTQRDLSLQKVFTTQDVGYGVNSIQTFDELILYTVNTESSF